MLRYKLQRVPFVEEQVRKIQEVGKVMTMDIERLLLSEDNRFEFVNSVAAEATEYVEKNRDEYGGTKKAIFHVLSNRVNDLGFDRPEAYAESDPYKPGPGYLKEYYTWRDTTVSKSLNCDSSAFLVLVLVPNQVNALTTLFL